MKVSIITVSFNAHKTIPDTLKSVAGQTYSDLEHIIVDGGSTDGTQQIIKDKQQSYTRWISEKDDGLYDAMNKGLNMASGDIVGFLNADDIFNDREAISRIAQPFQRGDVDLAFSDLAVVAQTNLQHGIRYFGARNFKPWHMRMGYMPPHPTVYVRRHILLKTLGFDTTFEIGADFELLLRLLVSSRCTYAYVPNILVRLRAGGLSTSGLKSTRQINKDFYSACKKNRVWTHPALLYARYLTKFTQFLRRPRDLAEA